MLELVLRLVIIDQNLRDYDNQRELIRTIYGTNNIVNDVKQLYLEEFEQARIDPLPRKIELKDYRIQITKQMKIGNLSDLIKKTNKDIVNCYEIENRTILLQKQLEFEKSKETVKEKRVDKRKLRDR